MRRGKSQKNARTHRAIQSLEASDLSALSRCLEIMARSLQETYAPKSVCFGCGPANPDGLHIRSIVQGREVVADWEPRAYHHAFDEILNGGIIATLFDCHSNWTAAEFLMRKMRMKSPPPTVTSDLQVKFLRPTPIGLVHLSARPAEGHEGRAIVEAKLAANGRVTATFRGTFVAVSKGHPAYHRWT